MMFDENGNVMTEKDKMREALDLLADVLALLYETESEEGHAACFMCDSAVKYLQVVYRGDDVLSASADYTAYENEIYKRRLEDEKCGRKPKPPTGSCQ